MSQSTSAADTRRYIVLHSAEGVGEYGYEWSESLSVRQDGVRYRHSWSGYEWRGTQGGVERYELYVGRDEARELWDGQFAGQHEESFDEAVAAALGHVRGSV
jgi:hypothetical protein